MKYLKINNRKGYFYNSEGKECEVSNITKEDMLYLLDELTKEDVEFKMDVYDENEIDNPAQKIIYENLYKKFSSLTESKNQFIDDSRQVYKGALEKYK